MERESQKWLTIRQAARYIGMSVGFLRRLSGSKECRTPELEPSHYGSTGTSWTDGSPLSRTHRIALSKTVKDR